MSKTPFSKKVEILGQVWVWYRNDPKRDEGWLEFFEWHDVGLPLAYFAKQGFASIKQDAKKYIDTAWNDYCHMLEIDPGALYIDVKSTFDASKENDGKG